MAYANVSRPMGFVPKFNVGRNSNNVMARPVAASRNAVGAAASAIIAIGDAYALDASSNAYHAGADAVVRGIVIGFVIKAVPTIMGGGGPISQDILLATDAGTVLGVEDAGAEFTVQCDTFAQANEGGLFALTDAAPDTTFRQSRQTLNIGGGAGTQFVAVKLDQSPADNAYGANARAVVRVKTTLQG